MENMSTEAGIPPEINRFNWGACLLTWIWAFGNRSFNATTGILLVCNFIPYVGLISGVALMIYGGVTGNKRAWKNRSGENAQHFHEIQRKWAAWGVGVQIFSLVCLTALAMPVLVKARAMSRQAYCINTLRQIESVKEQAALDNNYADGDVVPEQVFPDYIKIGLSGLVCPSGGRYAVNPIGQEPACSVHGTRYQHR